MTNGFDFLVYNVPPVWTTGTGRTMISLAVVAFENYGFVCLSFVYTYFCLMMASAEAAYVCSCVTGSRRMFELLASVTSDWLVDV